MSAALLLLALLGPPAAALIAGFIYRGREASPLATIVLNALSPGAGLAAAGRPTLETVLAVLMAQASLLVAGSVGSLVSYVPFMVVGAFWAAAHTPFSPLLSGPMSRPLTPVETPPSPPWLGSSPAPARVPPGSHEETDNPEGASAGYAIEVRCTECGAGVPVPVLQHMARCGFCGSDHLVVGQEETLYLTVPERTPTEVELREALLDHYRYQHYLKLFRSSVPLIQAGGTEVSPSGALISRPETEAAAAAAEAAIAKKADAYRARLADTLTLVRTLRFLAPYRHGMGTLYQAAFGRRPSDHEKSLSFAIGTVEASALASGALALPEMGRLSYLRALRPAADCPADAAALPLDRGEETLERAFGHLDRKQLDRSLATIRLGSRFSREVSAVLWRAWWVVEVAGSGIHETLLVDSASGSVAGPAPALDPDVLGELPREALEPGRGLRFVPMECPTCGDEFPFDSDAVLHFCRNCHRLCRVRGQRKETVEYGRADGAEDVVGDSDLVPFWLFPLRLRTPSGELVTDLAHLKDGIDGSYDQIGDDAPARQHGLYVPAVRCINSRLMGEAFNRLFDFTIRQRLRLVGERFPLDGRPAPWSIHLDEPEARAMAPLYLANVFGRRDLARANVNQVSDRLFDAVQEAPGRLVYLPVPRVVTNPFRDYVGRYRGRALRRAEMGS
ncbi:MAG TPA: hypothetical protein VLT32_13605 [Candidatus Sulfomarinibacteraceae bacterium]|nr:hypothetical protein [Candidatus Sulfomarinibacteraceae bacterium]